MPKPVIVSPAVKKQQLRFTMFSLYLALVSVIVIGVSQSYPYGAPACVSAPRHGLDPQEGDTDIEISKEGTEDGYFVIQLGAEEAEETFKGFMVLTKSPGEDRDHRQKYGYSFPLQENLMMRMST